MYCTVPYGLHFTVNTSRNSLRSPAVARQAQRIHPDEDTLCIDRIVASAACATLSAMRPFQSVHTATAL